MDERASKRQRLPSVDAAENNALGENVATAVQNLFRKLPKTGKPQPHEHTVLAGFAITTLHHPAPVVVALGTGTKCLGGTKRSSTGQVINDSHAEVIARRALLCWLMSQASLAYDGKCTETLTIFSWDAELGKLRLIDGVTCHMYVSQSPCGDASIIQPSKTADTGSTAMEQTAADPDGTAIQATCSLHSHTSSQNPESVGYRTGAKPILGKGGGADAEAGPSRDVPQAWHVERGEQQLGVVRRKPGRGDATLSMSCSDKLARWACLGLQGALLSGLMAEPLRLETLTVSCPADAGSAAVLEAVQRAVVGRLEPLAERLQPPFQWQQTRVHVVSSAPPDLGLCPSATRKTPSGVSINWSAGSGRAVQSGPQGGIHEVTLAADGRKAGAAKTCGSWDSIKTRSRLSKAAMLEAFRDLCHRIPPVAAPPIDWKQSTYAETKLQFGATYRRCWVALLAQPSVFEGWISKPADLESFGRVAPEAQAVAQVAHGSDVRAPEGTQ